MVLVQSELARHVRPAVQRGHTVAQPQSTSLSPPFLTMSVQVGVWQRAITHRLLWQSEATTQLSPSAQRGHAFDPPQSTSVSPSFWMPSVQLTQTPPARIPRLQSEPPEHWPPVAPA